MAATFAAMILLYALFSKFVPIISIWELKAGLQSRLDSATLAEAELMSTRLTGVTLPAEGEGAARMKAIYGLYVDPHVAQQAVDNLRAAGVNDADITGDFVRAVRSLRVRPPRCARRRCRGSPPGAGLIGLC